MVLLVEGVAYLLKQKHRVAVKARVLAGGHDVVEDGVDIGHVEVAAQQQCPRAPVVAPQEGVRVFQTAAAGGAVAQVAHVDLPDERHRAVDIVDIHVVYAGGHFRAHGGEDVVDGARAQGTLAVHVFVAGLRVELHHAYARGFLAAVVLLLHKQIQPVEGVGHAAVALLVVAQGAS